MKKIITVTLMLMMLMSTVCLAAVSSSGSKSSGSKPASSSSSVSRPSTSPSSTSGSYKPTAPANSYSDKAPTKQVTPAAQPQQPQSSTSSFWRNASLFGGGMLAGSLLGNMFGYGNMGGGASIFGMLINLLMIGAVVMGIRYVWNKYRNRNM